MKFEKKHKQTNLSVIYKLPLMSPFFQRASIRFQAAISIFCLILTKKMRMSHLVSMRAKMTKLFAEFTLIVAADNITPSTLL